MDAGGAAFARDPTGAVLVIVATRSIRFTRCSHRCVPQQSHGRRSARTHRQLPFVSVLPCLSAHRFHPETIRSFTLAHFGPSGSPIAATHKTTVFRKVFELAEPYGKAIVTDSRFGGRPTAATLRLKSNWCKHSDTFGHHTRDLIAPLGNRGSTSAGQMNKCC